MRRPFAHLPIPPFSDNPAVSEVIRQAAARRRVAIDSIDWTIKSSIRGDYVTDAGSIAVRHGRFTGGLSDGVEVVVIDTGVAETWVLPTRGMGLWQIVANDVRYGWDSPVPGPVHPDRVPVMDPSGLGWLEGFDELLVRCGLRSNGAPQFDDSGRLEYPLHGRIANLPANDLRIEIDSKNGHVDLSGTVIESRLFFQNLRLVSRLRMTANQPTVEITDDVTNDAASPSSIQLLYHINVGAPVLGDGATIDASIQSIRGKDDVSAAEIDQWHRCGPPQTGYTERVYLAEAQSDPSAESPRPIQSSSGGGKWAHVSITSPKTDTDPRGLRVWYDVETLPRLNVWKNTAAFDDGYVVGLEPATGHPMTRREEEAAGRVVPIEPGQTRSFHVTLQPF